ncbi:transposase [Collinsella sp. AF29-7AC]|uniref:transposase n=1 Tax=Collinsella sp. AF29-7AC TaxID=2292010 RepID=UPI001F1BE14C|nr:transposase [Collinsella sp. AF29-7AC]
MSANIVTVDEESLRKDIKNLVRKTVEETLNALLDEEASELVGTGRYERAAGREAHRGGHYARKLVTGAGEVESSARGCSARSRKCSPGDPLPALHTVHLYRNVPGGVP